MLMIQNSGASPYLLPAGAVVLFYGTAASIPEGWAIDTGANDNYIMGCELNAITDLVAGANTHVHTAPSTSTFASHTHTPSSSYSKSTAYTNISLTTAHNNAAIPAHTHGRSGSSSSAGSHAHTTSNVNNQDSHPPFRRLYWIKATADADLPIGGIVMLYGATSLLPTEMNVCNGVNGSPDMRAKFARGANSDGEVNVSGGATTHVHSNPNTSTVGSHAHTIYVTLTTSGGHQNVTAGTYKYVAKHGHQHTGSRASGSAGGHSHTIGNTGSATHLPTYTKLHFAMRIA